MSLQIKKLFMANAAEICAELAQLDSDGHSVVQVVRVGKYNDGNLSADWRANYLILYNFDAAISKARGEQ